MVKVSNLLSQIQNASRLHQQETLVWHTNLNQNICHILTQQGILKSFTIDGSKIIISLKYSWDGSPVFKRFQIISKKRVRKYTKKPISLGEQHSITIISTNQGLMTQDECFQHGIGGEILFRILL